MQAPWRDLKTTEMRVLGQRQRGRLLPRTLSRLRELVTKCGEDPDADASICYHGSLALLFEFDHDWTNALMHRQVEIRKIRRLHKLMEHSPSRGFATQNYRDEDLSVRIEILKQIVRARPSPNKADAPNAANDASVAGQTRLPRRR